MRRPSSLVLGLLCLPLSGCLTAGVVQTAETAGKDNFQFAFEPGITGIAGGGSGGFLPSFNVAARYGVSDRVDIGGRIGTTLIEAQAKFMVTEPHPDELQVSIAPHLGGLAIGAGDTAGGILWVKLPVLLDIPVGSSDLVLGPGIRYVTVFGVDDTGSGGNAGLLLIGSSVGFAGRVGDRARIIPELGIDYVLAGGVSGDGAGLQSLGDGITFSFQVGIVLGGRDREGN